MTLDKNLKLIIFINKWFVLLILLKFYLYYLDTMLKFRYKYFLLFFITYTQ